MVFFWFVFGFFEYFVTVLVMSRFCLESTVKNGQWNDGVTHRTAAGADQ